MNTNARTNPSPHEFPRDASKASGGVLRSHGSEADECLDIALERAMDDAQKRIDAEAKAEAAMNRDMAEAERMVEVENKRARAAAELAEQVHMLEAAISLGGTAMEMLDRAQRLMTQWRESGATPPKDVVIPLKFSDIAEHLGLTCGGMRRVMRLWAKRGELKPTTDDDGRPRPLTLVQAEIAVGIRDFDGNVMKECV